MARTKQPTVSRDDKLVIGSLLRDLRRSAGYRSVDAAARAKSSPSSKPTIYAYERGGLVPSLRQFLDLVEFYVLGPGGPDEGRRAEPDLRARGVAAVARALALPAYHVDAARDLMARMQPPLGARE
jgi:helix-turn-helix protein